MDLKNNTRVQVLDEELGRWESAKILKPVGNAAASVGETETESFLVTFPGWSQEYDCVIARKDIREPINPFENEIGKLNLIIK